MEYEEWKGYLRMDETVIGRLSTEKTFDDGCNDDERLPMLSESILCLQNHDVDDVPVVPQRYKQILKI